MMVGQLLSFQSGDLVIDLRTNRVTKAGAALDLEPKAFRVLVYLVENRLRTVTKEELFQAVWGETFVTDNALTRVIAQLRKELQDSARAPRYIETMPTLGYRFIAPVDEVREPEGAPGAPPARPHSSKVRYWMAAVAGTALLAFNAWFLLHQRRPDPPLVRVFQLTSTLGQDSGPALSPDGSSLAYSSDRNGPFEIYVRSLAPGGAETQLTNDGEQNLQPQWSPDGKYLAFYSGKRNGIRVMPALGGAIQQITEFGSSPVWSPDSREIAFRSEGLYTTSPMDGQPSGPSTIWVVNRDGSGLRQLTTPNAPPGFHSDPVWSRDGRILFSSFTQLFRANIWSVQSDGTRLEQLHIPGYVMATPKLMPDGRHLIYSTAQSSAGMAVARVRLVDRRTADTPEFLFTSPHSMPRELTVSADGRRVLFSLSWITSELWSLPVDPATAIPAGEAAAVVRNRTMRNSRALISPDGNRILFFSRPAGDSGEAYIVPAAGGEMRQIPLRAKPEFSATWGSDSASITYVSLLDGKRVLCTSALSGNERCVPVDIPLRAGTRVSPDGTKVSYHRPEADGTQASYVLNVASGHTGRISPPGTSVTFPCWSADSKWLAGELRNGDGTSLLLMPAAGGATTALAKDFRHAWPHTWSPDSRHIAFAGLRDGAWNVWWISPSTGESRMLTNYTKFSDYVRYPAWSPKGDRIVYELGHIGGNIYSMEFE